MTLFSRSFMLSFFSRIGYFKFISKLNLPLFACLPCAWFTPRLSGRSRYTVLCIDRPIFNEDIHALSQYSGSVNYLLLPKAILIQFAYRFIPSLIPCHANYYKERSSEASTKLYFAFCFKFLKYLKLFCHFDAILTANYNYSWQQELLAAAESLGIPTIILFKEGISPLQRSDSSDLSSHEQLVLNYSNNNFISSHLIVYNEPTKTAFIDSGIPGLTEHKISISGIPRFDKYYHFPKPGNTITFFSFNFEDKARHLNLDSKILNSYLEKTNLFHIEVFRFAQANPDTDIIIKTKSNKKYFNYVFELASNYGFSKLQNIHITNEGTASDLIRKSFAVIGYNSTTLIEAYVAGRTVIAPDFRGGPVLDFYADYPDLPLYFKSAEDISYILNSSTKHSDGFKHSLYSFLLDRIHLPDGKASSRAEDAIVKVISSSS